jgi:hypothetical protein
MLKDVGDWSDAILILYIAAKAIEALLFIMFQCANNFTLD